MRSIYLDYNATTPVAGSVREAMLPFYGEFFGDPSSNHWIGRVAQEAIEDARAAAATLVGCHPSEIVFTSGGTESVNLALLGSALQIMKDRPRDQHHLVLSSLEHLAVGRCAERLRDLGWEITRVRCDRHGVIDLQSLEDALRPTTRLVSIVHANHEIGTVQPIQEVSRLCAGRPILLHTDASQTAGKINCGVDQLGVDLLSLSGHKMYAPKGVGALYVRSGVRLQPQMLGEWQEGGFRGGMENVPHIVGLGDACRLVATSLEHPDDRLIFLRDHFLRRFGNHIGKEIHSHGFGAERLDNTASVLLDDRYASDVLHRAPELCFGPVGHDGDPNRHVGIAPTLAAMKVSPKDAASTFRLSVGWNTTQDEIETAADLLATAYDQSRPVSSVS
jgi:cysteine desulfurase